MDVSLIASGIALHLMNTMWRKWIAEEGDWAWKAIEIHRSLDRLRCRNLESSLTSLLQNHRLQVVGFWLFLFLSNRTFSIHTEYIMSGLNYLNLLLDKVSEYKRLA